MVRLVVIDYGYGNVHSLLKACEVVLPEKGSVLLSQNVEDIQAATHIILPGVGAFPDCMNGINQLPAVKQALQVAVIQEKKPFLGICVGMQLMAEEGLEHGQTKGLGWLNATVAPIPDAAHLKIPHMGWNVLTIKQQNHPIFHGIEDGSHVYFVHSYYMQCRDKNNIAATTDYGVTIPAVVIHDNKIGMQFHPEKSQQVGLTLLRNFLEWTIC